MNIFDIAAMHNRYVPDDVKLVEKNGRIWFMSPFKRYDPLTIAHYQGMIRTQKLLMDEGKLWVS